VPQKSIDQKHVYVFRAMPHASLGDERLRETAEILLPKTRWVDPPELKHISRCAVRRQLGRGWGLPNGIEELNVPLTLKSYLDLMED
jgi:SOCS box